MREIEFRGKRVDNGIWVFGYLVYNQDKVPFIVTALVCDNHFNPSTLQGLIRGYQVIPETVGQYTTRKTKTEKKIYEGDILVSSYTSPKYTVTWEKDRWKMCGTRNGNGFSIVIHDFMEIIGTIHD